MSPYRSENVLLIGLIMQKTGTYNAENGDL